MEKRMQFYLSHLYLALRPLGKSTRWNFIKIAGIRRLDLLGYLVDRLHDDKFGQFYKHWFVTDRQTDRQTDTDRAIAYRLHQYSVAQV